MQLTKYLSVLAFVPFLAGANPLAVEDVSSVNHFPLEARGGIGSWIDYYNGRRPHSTFAGRTPDEVYATTEMLSHGVL